MVATFFIKMFVPLAKRRGMERIMKTYLEKEDFNYYLQEYINTLLTQLLPLKTTLPYVSDDMKEACIDLYQFFRSLLNDMYQHYEEYDLLPDEKLGIVENLKRINFYYYYLIALTKYSVNNDRIIIETPKYMNLIKKFNKNNIVALARNGLVIQINDDFTIVSNFMFPKLFQAVTAVRKASFTNYKVNCDSFFIHCDFRALVNYKRTYQDVYPLFNEKNQAIVYALHEHSIEKKIKSVNCNYFYRVEYKLKGKIIFITDLINNNDLKINIGLNPYSSSSFELIKNRIEASEQAEGLKAFTYKFIAKKCENCKQVCKYKSNPTEVFQRKIIVCMGNPFIRIVNPDKNDINYLKELIDIRTELVENKWAEPFYPGNG